MLDFSGISERDRVAKIFAVLHSVMRTVSFNLKLASLLLVGLIRCGFMIKNQM